MERKTTYNVSTMTEKKYKDTLKRSFGLGLTGRAGIMGELGLKSMKTKNKMVMARILESVKWTDNVGVDFREEKLRQRKELNQVNLLRSVRFLNGLPCRGQRTQTNAGTSKRRAGKKRGGSTMRRKQNWRLRILARRRRRDGDGLKTKKRIPRIKFLSQVRRTFQYKLIRRLAKVSYRLLLWLKLKNKLKKSPEVLKKFKKFQEIIKVKRLKKSKKLKKLKKLQQFKKFQNFKNKFKKFRKFNRPGAFKKNQRNVRSTKSRGGFKKAQKFKRVKKATAAHKPVTTQVPKAQLNPMSQADMEYEVTIAKRVASEAKEVLNNQLARAQIGPLTKRDAVVHEGLVNQKHAIFWKALKNARDQQYAAYKASKAQKAANAQVSKAQTGLTAQKVATAYKPVLTQVPKTQLNPMSQADMEYEVTIAKKVASEAKEALNNQLARAQIGPLTKRDAVVHEGLVNQKHAIFWKALKNARDQQYAAYKASKAQKAANAQALTAQKAAAVHKEVLNKKRN